MLSNSYRCTLLDDQLAVIPMQIYLLYDLETEGSYSECAFKSNYCCAHT